MQGNEQYYAALVVMNGDEHIINRVIKINMDKIKFAINLPVHYETVVGLSL